MMLYARKSWVSQVTKMPPEKNKHALFITKK